MKEITIVVVEGIEFKGMSTMVVNPPAQAAEVAVENPSQAVRPVKSLQNLLVLEKSSRPKACHIFLACYGIKKFFYWSSVFASFFAIHFQAILMLFHVTFSSLLVANLI